MILRTGRMLEDGCTHKVELMVNADVQYCNSSQVCLLHIVSGEEKLHSTVTGLGSSSVRMLDSGEIRRRVKFCWFVVHLHHETNPYSTTDFMSSFFTSNRIHFFLCLLFVVKFLTILFSGLLLLYISKVNKCICDDIVCLFS